MRENDKAPSLSGRVVIELRAYDALQTRKLPCPPPNNAP